MNTSTDVEVATQVYEPTEAQNRLYTSENSRRWDKEQIRASHRSLCKGDFC